MINKLLAPEVQKFIKDHEKDDPFSLVLKNKPVHGVPVKQVAAQIAALQKAKLKLPEWHNTRGIIYPPLISMEQCSSEATARYKASLVSGKTLFDLTGGAGIDTFYLSKHFKEVLYVEQNAELANVTAHNLSHLKAKNITCKIETAEAFLAKTAENADVIYLDPARRDKNAQRVFRLEDCEPDVIRLLPTLLDKAGTVMLKTSPMLDIDLALKDLKHVHEVHVVSVANDCKEVLYLLRRSVITDPMIVAINLLKTGGEQLLRYQRSEEGLAQVEYALPERYLYEPNSSILKAGAFQLVAEKFGLSKLHQHTHLYTGRSEISNFPGRGFRILAAVPYNKKAVLPFLPDKKANLAARNFPDDIKTIKKKLGIEDGSNKYLFAFTDMEGQRKIVITEKLQ